MKYLGALAVLVFLNACSVAGIRPYDPYFKNTQQLQNVKEGFSRVSVSSAIPGMQSQLQKSSMQCRLTTFNMPANKTVGDYVTDAMTAELDAAKKLSPQGKPLSIQVNKLESNTASMNKGHWTVDFTYSAKGGSRTVSTVTEFESAYVADTACRNTADALQQALRENFGKYFSELSK